MDEVFSQEITNTEIRMEIENLTTPSLSGDDIVAFFQTLNQLHGLCQHPVDNYTKTQQRQCVLQSDYVVATLL